MRLVLLEHGGMGRHCLLELEQVPEPHRGGQGQVGLEGAAEGGLVEGGALRDVPQEELHDHEELGHLPSEAQCGPALVRGSLAHCLVQLGEGVRIVELGGPHAPHVVQVPAELVIARMLERKKGGCDG